MTKQKLVHELVFITVISQFTYTKIIFTRMPSMLAMGCKQLILKKEQSTNG